MIQSDYEKTGLLYVDMVAAAVSHYKKQVLVRRRSLSIINLSPKGFVQFSDWTRANLPEEQADAHIEKFTFDGVEVRMNSKLMGEQIYFDFNYEKQAEA